tara:strand:+ start:401 stop:850 length:450 start_codon:yes stop_codon:yes gene_type:complete
MSKTPNLINVQLSYDDRGELTHCNNFSFQKKKIKRFYQISNHKMNFVRAWHGHKFEKKYILIIQGSLKICTIKIDNWRLPSKKLNKKTFILTEKNPQILYIPGGFAHGTQNLNLNTKFIVFSNFDIKQSLTDDYRFESDYWGNWNIKNR